jgi:hypothetical protein
MRFFEPINGYLVGDDTQLLQAPGAFMRDLVRIAKNGAGYTFLMGIFKNLEKVFSKKGVASREKDSGLHNGIVHPAVLRQTIYHCKKTIHDIKTFASRQGISNLIVVRRLIIHVTMLASLVALGCYMPLKREIPSCH